MCIEEQTSNTQLKIIISRYSIIGGNEDGKFKIDPMNGKIMVAKDNDIGMYYTLEMGVSDGRFSDRCIVKIDVKKSDNSGLVFAKERYQTSVLENSTKSDIILVVNVLGSALNENLQVITLKILQLIKMYHI